MRARWLALGALLVACGGGGAAPHPDSGSGPGPRTETEPARAAPPGRRETAPAATPTERAAPSPPAYVAPAPPDFMGTELSADDLMGLLGHAFPQQFKPVGSSSVVFRMRLEGPITGAFRPRSRMHPRGHLAELAAYRIARLLGMDQVPPAISRRVSRVRMERRLHPDFVDSWPDIRRAVRWDDDGTTEGAAVYWIPRMRELGLDQGPAIERWSRWLEQSGDIPEGKRALARDLSQCVVFDYLIANWDRYSGGNLMGTRDGSRIFIRDHNLAFGDPVPEHLHRRMWDRLVATERFSRSQILALAALTRARLDAELSRDPLSESRRILSASQLRGVFDRREAILSHVAALSERLGADRVLYFP